MSTVITAAPLAGRVAIVTGASSGIGEATAFRLATLGAKVAVAARRTDNLDALAARITAAGGTALPLPLDVTERTAVNAAAQQVADRLGTVDLVFNNAGVQLISPIEDVRFDDWQRQIDLNITGVMNVIGAFVPQLIASAAQGKPADLITTSSIAATRVLEKFSVYSGTKAYISQLTRLLRVELGRKMVRVSTIEPGMVDTELPDHVTDPDATRLMADLINDIDVLTAADVAETVAFIASVPRHVNLTEITILPTQQAVYVTMSRNPKTVLITGASSGIGEATALRLADDGHRLFLGARRTERLEALVERIGAAGGTASFRRLDVTDAADVQRFVADATDTYGGVDVMINNAGVMPLSALAEDKVDEWNRMIDVNIRGVLHGISAALPVMRAQGSGHIVNLASIGAHEVEPTAAVYCATKFAVWAISEGLRKEQSGDIKVSVISPGVTESELAESISDEHARDAMREYRALAIPASAIADAIAFAIGQPPEVDVNEIIVRPAASTH